MVPPHVISGLSVETMVAVWEAQIVRDDDALRPPRRLARSGTWPMRDND